MRGHYEGTYFDMSVDVGAGPFQSIYRARPLVWKDPANGKSYHNERPIGVQQTAWHLTSQMRKFLPNAIGTILWFGVDDTAHSVHVPFYNSVTRVSQAWADEGIQHVDDTKASLKVDFGKAWWMFNIVANYAYSRYNAISPVVQSEIVKIETQYFDATEKLEKEALQLINEGKTDDAVEMLTKFSENAGDDIVAHWLEFLEVIILFIQRLDEHKSTSSATCRWQRQAMANHRAGRLRMEKLVQHHCGRHRLTTRCLPLQMTQTWIC